MEPIHILAALASALLHAGWNAAVKASPRPDAAMAGQMVAGAVMVVPVLAWIGLPPAAAWPWVLASTSINLVVVTALLRAYALGGFGTVYPVQRAVSVLCVVPLAAALAGEHLAPAALIGVGLIVLALALLALGARRERGFPPSTIGWTLLAGLASAAYVLCDARGVRASHSALSYGFTASIANAITMTIRQKALGTPWRNFAGAWSIAIPNAIASMASYILILWVWTHAPVAAGAALRDTSAVFAILIAVLFLHERFTPTRLAAVLIACVAVPLLRLA